MATETRSIAYVGETQPWSSRGQLTASLRQSVARDMLVWRRKVRMEKVGEQPYRWFGKRLSFAPEQTVVETLPDGRLRITVSVSMTIEGPPIRPV